MDRIESLSTTLVMSMSMDHRVIEGIVLWRLEKAFRNKRVFWEECPIGDS